MKIGIIVIDDGIYTHLWVRRFLEDGNHTICAGACLSPFSAHNFNPQDGCVKAILSRIRYYGGRATLKFGWRFLCGMMADALFRVTAVGRAESVRSILSSAGIPLIPIPNQDINGPDFQDRLKAYKPDVLVCAFSQKTGESLRRLAPLGCLNIHFSCLPENAGREPVFWSLLRGQGYGITVYRMSTALDSGQMLTQKRLGTADLHSLDAAIQKVCTHVPAALSAALQRIKDGTGSQMPIPNLNPWPGPNDIQAFREAGFRFV